MFLISLSVLSSVSLPSLGNLVRLEPTRVEHLEGSSLGSYPKTLNKYFNLLQKFVDYDRKKFYSKGL
jgi:hypothetical protein